jgi:CHAT domain-containing protein
LAYYRNSVKLNTEDKYTYTKFWKPIKEKIPNGVVVYISPDGSYCQINLETAYNDGKYAIEENQFLYLTNSVDLASEYRATKGDKNNETGKIILCGDPDFYSNKINSGAVVALAGTEKEVGEIQKIAKGYYNNEDIIVLTNEKVLEDSIKKIKSPFIFHIATHGYFKETKNSGDGEFRSNPLLNSGLLLGNSGDILESQDAYVNQKSGILTAYEVSNMDFDNTKLVVLSACETGKGEVQIGEGVMGLVRAFTIAGGKAIVNSLFKVQDDATVKFMTLFYKYFIEYKNEKDAMIFAKREMKKIYPQPLNWGSFILYEAGH